MWGQMWDMGADMGYGDTYGVWGQMWGVGTDMGYGDSCGVWGQPRATLSHPEGMQRSPAFGPTTQPGSSRFPSRWCFALLFPFFLLFQAQFFSTSSSAVSINLSFLPVVRCCADNLRGEEGSEQ